MLLGLGPRDKCYSFWKDLSQIHIMSLNPYTFKKMDKIPKLLDRFL